MLVSPTTEFERDTDISTNLAPHPLAGKRAVAFGCIQIWRINVPRQFSALILGYWRQYSGVRTTNTGRISSRPIHIRTIMKSFAGDEKSR